MAAKKIKMRQTKYKCVTTFRFKDEIFTVDSVYSAEHLRFLPTKERYNYFVIVEDKEEEQSRQTSLMTSDLLTSPIFEDSDNSSPSYDDSSSSSDSSYSDSSSNDYGGGDFGGGGSGGDF